MFGEYFLDVGRRELRCGQALVRLAPQVFDVLLYLLHNRDRVVTKDDLLEAVWGGRIVSESALTTRINAARKAIGDSGEAQRLIRTLPRRGFRFIGRVGEGDRIFEPQEQTTVGAAGAPEQAAESLVLDQPAELYERLQVSDAQLPIAISAERRQLTVVSCNLAGAAALASRLDPASPGPRRGRPTISPSSPGRASFRAKLEKAWPCWMRLCRSPTGQGSTGSRRS
jgi:DNA-binding winged helix-turn-helix (wHTH) protein